MKPHAGRKTENENDEFTSEQFRELDAQMNRYRDKSGATIRVMGEAQEIFGYLPRNVMRRIAAGLGVPPADIYGIATFYSHFTTTPPAKHNITSCQGTACYVRGGRKVLDALERSLKIRRGETTPDREFSIQSVRCMGACALAPVIRIDTKIHSRVSPGSVGDLLPRQVSGHIRRSPAPRCAEGVVADCTYRAGLHNTV